LPDKNGDEPDQRDETWVLYDRQFVDDELFSLYATFKSGVRILVLSDSCHSGTCAKQLPNFLNPGALEARFGTSDPAGIERRVRTIPLDVRRRVEEANEALYDEVQRSTPANDNVDLDASLLLISGCQDNQTSADGDRNGLFTGTLLDVWNGGKFKRYYRGFHRAIVEQMPPDQTPNLFFIGGPNPKFRRQKPFMI
jgi:metacaspase-1